MRAETERSTRMEAIKTACQMTVRQREVVKRLSEGATAKEIASELGVSAKTVEYHSASARQIIGSPSIAILTRFALLCELSDLTAVEVG